MVKDAVSSHRVKILSYSLLVTFCLCLQCGASNQVGTSACTDSERRDGFNASRCDDVRDVPRFFHGSVLPMIAKITSNDCFPA